MRKFAVDRRWSRGIVDLEEDDPRLVERFAGGRLLLHDGSLIPLVSLGNSGPPLAVCVIDVDGEPVGLPCRGTSGADVSFLEAMPSLRPADLPAGVVGCALVPAGRVWVLDPLTTAREAGIVPQPASTAVLPSDDGDLRELPELATKLGLALELELMLSKIADVEDEQPESDAANIIRMWNR